MQPRFSRCPDCHHVGRAEARFCGQCGAALPDLSLQHQMVRVAASAAFVLEPRLSTAQNPLSSASGLAIGATLGHGSRYRILELLGKGGFGEAYLAHDQHLDRSCVIKRLILKSTWSEEYCQRVEHNFAREAHMLVRLNTPGHPNIPEIYEYLADEYCLVMKHIKGQNLGKILEKRIGALPESEALHYIREVCAALVYMHSFVPEPVLHRDIKPANMLLGVDGRVWLIDFGLAKASVPVLPQGDPGTTEALGTPGFTPIEQWQFAAEPRSDVYALAATLWVLLTNRRLAVYPKENPPLRQLNPAIRPGVERLVAWGMTRDVAARPTATEFLASLESLLTHIEIPPPPRPASPPVTNRFIGREDMLLFFNEQLIASGTAFITGLAGIGKTALAAALAQHNGTIDHIYWHTLREGEGAEAVIWSLAAYLAQDGRDEVWRQLQIAQQTGTPPPPPETLCDYLLPLLRDHQDIVCLDDLHLAQQNALIQRLCERLRDAAHNGAIKLIITARFPPAFAQTNSLTPLNGLSPTDARALLATHNVHLSHALSDQLTDYTGGNPQLLLLSSAVLAGRDKPEELVANLAKADNIEQYLVHEVDLHLTDNERSVMRAVAVLGGYGGTHDAIEAVLAGADVHRALGSLSRRSLLLVQSGATGEKEYTQHAIVQIFYYAQLSKTRRRSFHQRAGEYYTTEEPDLLRAAHHIERAGDYGRAAALATADVGAIINKGQAHALEQLLKQFQAEQLDPEQWVSVCTARGEVCALLGDYQTAREQLTLALAQGKTLELQSTHVEAQARRYRLLALVGERTGVYEQARADCREGLALLEQLPQPPLETARLYAQLGLILSRQGDLDGAEQACSDGLALLNTEASGQRERVALLERLATIDGDRGRITDATAKLEQSLEVARGTGDPILIASVLSNLGLACSYGGKNEKSLECYREGLQIYEQIGDVAGRVKIMGNMGIVYLNQGDRDASLNAFHTCYDLSKRMQLARWSAFATMSIGQVYYDDGDWGNAEEYLQQARTIYSKFNDMVSEANCLYKLGDIALVRGIFDTAIEYASQGLMLAQRVRAAAFEACALRVLGEVLLAQGWIDVAASHLEQAWQIEETVADPYDQAMILAALGHLSAAKGDRERAREEARTALELARACNIRFLIVKLELLLETVDTQHIEHPSGVAKIVGRTDIDI